MVPLTAVSAKCISVTFSASATINMQYPPPKTKTTQVGMCECVADFEYNFITATCSLYNFLLPNCEGLLLIVTTVSKFLNSNQNYPLRASVLC